MEFWENALQQQNCQYDFISYDMICNDSVVAFPKIKEPTYLRITSPGEDFDLQKRLLKIGGYADADSLHFEKGVIFPNEYWYRGWCVVLQKIEGFISRNPLLKVLNNPASIQLAFHKLNCQKLLSNQGISTPKIILNQISKYDSLIHLLKQENIHQVFIKPYHGSSASGVMALRQNKGKQILYTTIELKGNQLYNNLKLQKYSSIPKIKTIVDSMIPRGLLVEEWIRKKTFQKKSVDFRILVINGKAAFVVPRMSPHIITNLHLGNEKGNIDEVENVWGKELIHEAKTLAENAVKIIDGLFYGGVDVAISANGIPYVLEINAFGDLLLNIFQKELNAYEFELKEVLENGIY